jgi:phosphonate transport system substrate-binding protein
MVRSVWVIFGLGILLGMAALVWLSSTTPKSSPAQQTPPFSIPATTRSDGAMLRIGVIPERDIFEQRRRYLALADYLSDRLGRPVELVTAQSYEAMIGDLRDKQVDVAFLGSLVAVLAADRLDAQILVKPQLPGAISTYRGVIFVAENSPIRSVKQLSGKSIAMVRTTTGANLFPVFEFMRNEMFGSSNAPRVTWVGTHDDVILEVLDGRADAGAVKGLRLDEFEKDHPNVKFPRLVTSESVPENALVVRKDLAAQLGPVLRDELLKMDSVPEGRGALASFGAERFVPCRIDDYRAIYDMVDVVSGVWDQTGIGGEPPARPASLRQGSK